jgi:hypothetical protein
MRRINSIIMIKDENVVTRSIFRLRGFFVTIEKVIFVQINVINFQVADIAGDYQSEKARLLNSIFN